MVAAGVDALGDNSELLRRAAVQPEAQDRLVGCDILARERARHIRTRQACRLVFVVDATGVEADAFDDLQLRRLADGSLGLLHVFDAGQLDQQAVVAQTLDARLGHSEAVNPARDRTDQSFHLLIRGLEFFVACLVNQLRPACQVEPQPQAQDVLGSTLAQHGEVVVRYDQCSRRDPDDNENRQ